jgi:hypothetical protein
MFVEIPVELTRLKRDRAALLRILVVSIRQVRSNRN